jgi:SET domain-containing protein
VAKSRIHRFGVFALEDIRKGQQVIEYTGKRLAVDLAARIRFPNDCYLVSLKPGWAIDGRVGGSGAEFINHACNPNLRWRRVGNHMFFFARRRIKMGEELTLNYRYAIKLRRIPCRCGSRNCRGTLRFVLC